MVHGDLPRQHSFGTTLKLCAGGPIFTGTNADRESIYFPCTADHERDYILNKERSPLMLPLAIRKLHPAQIELALVSFGANPERTV